MPNEICYSSLKGNCKWASTCRRLHIDGVPSATTNTKPAEFVPDSYPFNLIKLFELTYQGISGRNVRPKIIPRQNPRLTRNGGHLDLRRALTRHHRFIRSLETRNHRSQARPIIHFPDLNLLQIIELITTSSQNLHHMLLLLDRKESTHINEVTMWQLLLSSTKLLTEETSITRLESRSQVIVHIPMRK